MKRILLDTNSYSLFRANDNRVRKAIQESEIIILPLIVIGELYSGFYRGNKFDQNELELEGFISNSKVTTPSFTKETSKIYGRLLAILTTKGTPITANDIWIAAQAIETDSTLITYDKHFLKIPGVKI